MSQVNVLIEKLLHAEAVSLRDSQVYLRNVGSIRGSSDDTVVNISGFVRSNLAAWNRSVPKNIDFTSLNQELLPRVAATAIATLKRGLSIDNELACVRLLLAVLSSPAAGAMGCVSYGVLHLLYTHLNNIVQATMRENTSAANRKSSRNDTNASATAALVAATTSGDLEIDIEDEDDLNENSSEASSPIESLSRTQLNSLVSSLLQAASSLSVSLRDEHLRQCYTELYLKVIFLTVIRSDLVTTGLVETTHESFFSLALSSEFCLLAAHRALLPFLTLSVGRTFGLPAGPKTLRSCHVATLNLFQELTMRSLSAERQTLALQSVDHDSANVAVEKVGELTRTLVYLVSTLQRMLLACSDRAAMRVLISQSVVDTLSALVRRLNLADTNETTNEDADRMAATSSIGAALTSFLNFLMRLSRSAKAQHRVVSLEVTCHLLSSDWIWNLPPPVNDSVDSTKSAKGAYGDILFVILLQRCEDVASAVRLRAVGTLHDLVVAASEKSPRRLLDTLYSLAMGVAEDVGSHIGYSRTILEVLRILAIDEKPVVRSKALQTIGLCLRRSWWHVLPHQLTESVPLLEAVPLLIEEDDLNLLGNACKDRSLMVRKAALTTLSSLLAPCAHNELVRRVWASSCLPLALDAEATVIAKVSSAVSDAIFSSAIAWKDPLSIIEDAIKSSTPSAAAVVSNDPQWSYGLLSWHLVTEINDANLTPLLKTAVVTLLKQGAVSFSSSSTSSISFFALMDSCRRTCQVEMTGLPSVDSLLEIAKRGAWIVFDLLVGCGQLSVLDAATQNSTRLSTHLARVGSIDFAVEAFRRQHGTRCSDNAMNAASSSSLPQDHIEFGENDVRLLRIVEKLAINLSLDDISYLTRETDGLLATPTLPANLVAIAVSLRFSLSTAMAALQHGLVGHGSASNGDALPDSTTLLTPAAQKVRDTDVVAWTSALAVRAHATLSAYVFESLELSHGTTRFLSKTSLQHLSSIFSAVSNSNDNSGDLRTAREAAIDAVISSLVAVGELVMLGFRMEEVDPSRLRIEADPSRFLSTGQLAVHSTNEPPSFRVIVPPTLTDLVAVLMGRHLPSRAVLNAAAAAGDESNALAVVRASLSSPTSTLGRLNISRVRAVSFIVMGKCCLRSENTARSAINLYLREISAEYAAQTASSLSSGQDTTTEVSLLGFDGPSTLHTSIAGGKTDGEATVRMNALLVLGDLCVRHTHLVDRHIDRIAACLQDSSVAVRRHALLLLTQLLAQDFVKWRGLILYRFLALTTDTDVELATMARDILARTLAVKFPTLLQNHLAEAFIILNQCTEHPAYGGLVSSREEKNTSLPLADTVELAGTTLPELEKEDKEMYEGESPSLFHLTLSLSRVQRFAVYEFMVSDLSDEGRITVTARLVSDLLSPAVDNARLLLPDRSAQSVAAAKTNGPLTPFETALEDALLFLRSPSLKIGTRRGTAAGGEESVDAELAAEEATALGLITANAAVQAAKNKVLRTLSTQHLVSHLLPVLVSLKHVLAAVRSPLQGALMDYLLVLSKQHKAEVDIVLATDSTLRAEIEYDLKSHERQKKAIAATPAAASGGFSAASVAASRSKLPMTPYLDVRQSAFKKPSMKAPGTVQTAALAAAATGGTASRRMSFDMEALNEDPIDRLTQGVDADVEVPIAAALESRTPKVGDRRRSWGVVVRSLVDEDEQEGDISTKKRRMSRGSISIPEAMSSTIDSFCGEESTARTLDALFDEVAESDKKQDLSLDVPLSAPEQPTSGRRRRNGKGDSLLNLSR